jgi:hypothetical protein
MAQTATARVGARGRRHETPVLASLAVLAGGASLLLAGVVLALLVRHAGVSGDGFPPLGKVVVRATSGVFMLPLAALMLARLPRHRIGWILCAAALGSACATFALQYATYSHFVRALPGSVWVGWVGEWVSAPGLLLTGIGLLLFPTGSLPSRRWRPLLWCGIAAVSLITLSGVLGSGDDLAFQGNPLVSDSSLDDLWDGLGGLGWLLLLIATVGGVVSLARRSRTSTGEVHQQVRLLGWASGVVAFGIVACALTAWLAPLAFDLGSSAFVLSLGVLAAAMAIAILRYRLYGLDVYVDRALVLTGLTVVLGSVYVAAVVVAGRLLGQQVELGIALPATAFVAVAIGPARD